MRRLRVPEWHGFRHCPGVSEPPKLVDRVRDAIRTRHRRRTEEAFCDLVVKSPMARPWWIRARLARIQQIVVCGTWLEIEADESLASNRPSPLRVDTRQRRRVSTQNRRLAWVFVIAFAR